MNREKIFATWAPEHSIWTPWAKPVLFAHMLPGALIEEPAETSEMLACVPPADGTLAVVLDLPGEIGVRAGAVLAGRGYRPVPLYNALPLVREKPLSDPAGERSLAVVDVRSILNALAAQAARLAASALTDKAPPVFLLDANRHGTGQEIWHNQFDNRSVCFTTDFPSANFLSSHGIRQVLLVQEGRLEPLADLAHVLRRWQDGGLQLRRALLDSSSAVPFQVPRPSWYGVMFQRVLAAVGLKRSASGGFGGWMMDSSSAG